MPRRVFPVELPARSSARDRRRRCDIPDYKSGAVASVPSQRTILFSPPRTRGQPESGLVTVPALNIVVEGITLAELISPLGSRPAGPLNLYDGLAGLRAKPAPAAFPIRHTRTKWVPTAFAVDGDPGGHSVIDFPRLRRLSGRVSSPMSARDRVPQRRSAL